MTTIEELMKEYSKWMSQANHFESQYKEAIQNAESIQRVINLMKKTNTGEEKEGSLLTLEPSQKYNNMDMPSAMFDILKNEPNLTAEEIYQRLITNGFQSKSKTFKRDVATRLYSFKKKGSIHRIKRNKLYRYSLVSDAPIQSRRTKP
jgi:hypothetical protein